MEKYFHVREKGSTVKTEVLAGLTTFMAMAYILMVNAGMFSELGVVSYGAIYIATAISAVIGTVLIGLLANLPLAQASGMGLNAYFVYTVCFGFGLSYANALVLVLLDGIIFIVLTVTGLREKIFEAIPAEVRAAIPAGIGLFIAFIGLQNAGIVVNDAATCVNLVSMNFFSGSATWAGMMPILVTFASLLATAVMSSKNIKGSVLWGILGGAVAYYILGFTVPGFYDGFAASLSFNPMTAFAEFGTQAFGKVFTEGFDFSQYLANNSTGSLIVLIITSALAFCLVDMFDTIGTLYGACARGGLLTSEGKVPNMNKAMLADAIATSAGAVLGTSTTTTYVESSAGVGAGAKTGLSSIVTGLLFLLAIFFAPIFTAIPGFATAPALIFVGFLMVSAIVKIDFEDLTEAVPAYLCMLAMPLMYSIAEGIAIGVISYVIINLICGKHKKITPLMYILAVLFVCKYIFL